MTVKITFTQTGKALTLPGKAPIYLSSKQYSKIWRLAPRKFAGKFHKLGSTVELSGGEELEAIVQEILRGL
ncbi:hypothetical protein KAR91_13870 [Candidatus Pacearchaeota archaeon]|nr:hypothetical protein [Candidatus Pacearchaeota archaeon]